ncbi:MAG: TonB-dependent receptor plug domain-containing protein [Candidatus Marinimicrobia bacterium]|nr:TonB-dependent receptor plug domain-containing protein [Candidatus Neomarinimicrobiota bacterium]
MNESNSGIAVVYIHNINKDIWNMSDYNGRFYLNNNYQVGDTLEFTHVGYHSQKYILSNVEKKIHIILIPKVIEFSEVNYTEDIKKSDKDNEITVSKNIYSADMETKNLIRKLPGITIKSYGGLAGISSISIDGGTSSHTKILVDGFDLTNAQNGLMDISQLPTPFIESINYLFYDINKYGSGSVDGVVNFIPWRNSNSVSYGYGSYGYLSSNVKLNLYLKSTSIDLLIGFMKDDGNYDYEWRGENSERKNNDFEQRYIAWKVNTIISKQIYAKIFLLKTEQKRGVAGQKWSPNLLARRNDNLFAGAFRIGWIGKKGFGKLNYLHKNSDDNYSNPNINVKSFYENITNKITLNQNYLLGEKIETIGNISIKNEIFKNDTSKLYERNIFSNSLEILYKPMETLEFKPSIIYVYSPENIDQFNYSLGTTLFPKNKMVKSFSFHYAKLFRIPSFNDMYWEPGGNPNLLTEETGVFNFSTKFHYRKYTDYRISMFYKESQNLIQWMPQQSYWQPENIAKTTRYGVKFSIDWNCQPLNLIGNFHYEYLISKNKVEGNYFDKQLRYAPKNISSFNLSWNPKRFYSSLQIDYNDEKISLYGYPNDVKIPQFILFNYDIGYTFEIFKRDFIAVLSVENIFDYEYETILGYPESGRKFKLTTTFNIKKKAKAKE